ncbi:MAG: hypothetical protein RR047_01050 [Bacilli bacterium]
MQNITSTELKAIDGGLSVFGGCILIAFIVLAAGIIDGFTRPLKCN